jgi:hypothetical protein
VAEQVVIPAAGYEEEVCMSCGLDEDLRKRPGRVLVACDLCSGYECTDCDAGAREISGTTSLYLCSNCSGGLGRGASVSWAYRGGALPREERRSTHGDMFLADLVNRVVPQVMRAGELIVACV